MSTETPDLSNFWAVIPAGGAGTRLWPLSRQHSPKFLHDLTGSGRTLLQATVDRLQPTAGPRVMVVTGAVHRDAVMAQVPEVADVVAEPSPRDSMAAIGLAAALLERRDPEAVMGSFAADHVIADTAAFSATVRTAVTAARAGWLVTLGITPTHPATGFGYIRTGQADPELPGVHAVGEFVEKPDLATATEYLAAGTHLWNAGMFVVRPTVLLDLLADSDPAFAAALRTLAAAPERLEEIWATLPRIALDHAVAEPAAAAGRVAVVPVSFDWDDVGDFASLQGLVAQADEPVTVLGERDLVQAVDSSGIIVPAAGRAVAVVGLENVVVVDTGDALLVTTLDRAQDVKTVVARLAEQGRNDLV